MSPAPRRFEYSVAVEADGRMSAGGEAELDPPREWTAEHLVLAGLARCTLASLGHYARRGGVGAAGAATATGVVSRREEDGAYAFVDVACRLDVRLDPAPEGDELRSLLADAERGCFVGSSLTAPPRYSWTVNGRAVS